MCVASRRSETTSLKRRRIKEEEEEEEGRPQCAPVVRGGVTAHGFRFVRREGADKEHQ